MSDGESLLNAILANPADDTPRLVYADCIEEEGEKERAEFIRVQCELAGLGFNPSCPKCGSYGGPCDTCESTHVEYLRRHERELLAATPSYKPWTTNAYAWFNPSGIEKFYYTRGFVSALTCSWQDWLAHANAICACQPIERVKLTTWPEMNNNPSLIWDRIAFELPAATYDYVGAT